MIRFLLAAIPADQLSRNQELRVVLMALGVAVSGIVAIIVITLVRYLARSSKPRPRIDIPKSPWELAGQRAEPIDPLHPDAGNPGQTPDGPAPTPPSPPTSSSPRGPAGPATSA